MRWAGSSRGKSCYMKPLLAALLLALPVISFAQYTYNNLQVNFLEKDTDAKSYTHENLRLYPVYSKEGFRKQFGTVGKYMSLQEAITKNKVRITETSTSGSVNNLVIENVSNDTVMVTTGDLVKGGKQDRIVEQDMVLNPKSGKKNIKVFCVEQGRWADSSTQSRRGAVSTSTNAEFKQHYNKGSMGLRKVVEKEKVQSKVWSKVSDINTVNQTSNSTSTYTALNNSAEYNKKLTKYLEFFKTKFANEQNVIGVVVVSGNKVLGCDMFATSELFKSQFESLLHSYATEAIVSGKPVTVTTATVKSYMDKLLTDEKVQAATLKEKGNSFVSQGKKLRVSSFD